MKNNLQNNKITVAALIPNNTKRKINNIAVDVEKSESSFVVYGMEKDSIAYLSEYIKNHPRMKDAEMHRLICKYFYLKQQLIQLKDRVLAIEERLKSEMDDISERLLLAEQEEILYLIDLIPYAETLKQLEETLIAHNLRLIIKIANSYAGKGLSVDDLIQEGVFGFLYAIDRYDPNKNVKLGTYATWWIKQKITRALSNKARLIRLPVHLTIDITKVLGAIRKHRIPYSTKNIGKLSKLTKMKDSSVSHAFSYIYSYTPYNQIAAYTNDTKINQDPMTDIVDKERVDNYIETVNLNLDQATFCSNFTRVLNILSPLEKEFICYKYGLLGYTCLDPISLKSWAKGKGIKQPIFFKKTAMNKLVNEILK
jgi:RNA polymerase nonessential primary-like sigma factor